MTLKCKNVTASTVTIKNPVDGTITNHTIDTCDELTLEQLTEVQKEIEKLMERDMLNTLAVPPSFLGIGTPRGPTSFPIDDRCPPLPFVGKRGVWCTDCFQQFPALALDCLTYTVVDGICTRCKRGGAAVLRRPPSSQSKRRTYWCMEFYPKVFPGCLRDTAVCPIMCGRCRSKAVASSWTTSRLTMPLPYPLIITS